MPRPGLPLRLPAARPFLLQPIPFQHAGSASRPASSSPPTARRSPTREDGSATVYTWKGGYKTVRVPAKYAEGEDGKRGKQISAARTLYLRCQAEVTTNSDYTIRSIRTVGDIPGENSASYCAEFLAPAQPAQR